MEVHEAELQHRRDDAVYMQGDMQITRCCMLVSS